MLLCIPIPETKCLFENVYKVLVGGEKTWCSPSASMGTDDTVLLVCVQVGGIKEKLLAAHRAGIRHVVLPQRNEKVPIRLNTSVIIRISPPSP
jgi:PDZ domain-containing secreted protein